MVVVDELGVMQKEKKSLEDAWLKMKHDLQKQVDELTAQLKQSQTDLEGTGKGQAEEAIDFV